MVSQTAVQRVKALTTQKPVFIAAKTWCPHCKAARALLFEALAVPADKVVLLELDTMEDGAEVQDSLAEITGQSTVPCIFIDGKFIGGNSDLQALNSKGQLKGLLTNAFA